MIVGRGLLGRALQRIDTEQRIFYVNGISNSVAETITEDNFESSEIQKIAKTNRHTTFIYFSTIQVNVKENYARPYVQHKIKMESLVKDLFPSYVIIRTSNLVGQNPWNNHTLFNFLYESLKEEKKITILGSAMRNILDVDDFITLTDYYLNHIRGINETRNIVNPIFYTMFEIMQAFETVFKKRFVKDDSTIDIAKFEASCEFSKLLAKTCGINLDDYLKTVLTKYYPAF